jgi:hypothetical protein
VLQRRYGVVRANLESVDADIECVNANIESVDANMESGGVPDGRVT